MEPLKEMYNAAFFQTLAASLHSAYPALSEESYIADCMEDLDSLELKDRLRRTTEVSRKHLPDAYGDALEILMEVSPKPEFEGSFASMFFPDFVGLYGREEFDLSMKGLKHFTKTSSSEFAIREFFRLDFDRTLKVMIQWASDENHHVRRLSSEGARPRLPWSFQLKNLLKDPSPVFPILETLQADEELYVRKSVANHLNDISKDHPEAMLDLVKNWDRSHKHTAWIVKQGARTLIKQGHPGALILRGFDPNPQINAGSFEVQPSNIQLGDEIRIAAGITSTSDKAQKLAIDYIVHYVKKSGAASAKVFKWKEVELAAGASLELKKKQVVKDFSTRKHYAGFHKVEFTVNGVTMGAGGFELG